MVPYQQIFLIHYEYLGNNGLMSCIPDGLGKSHKEYAKKEGMFE